MNIHNIAAVRATNAIPFDGVVRPVKDVPFIKKETGTPFAGEMFSLLRRKGLLEPIDWDATEVERQVAQEKNKQILAEYMPHTSIYNSMVLWSLNGLVPDDAFNTFSKKSCAIIEGLEEQMEQGTEIVSLHPTDTAIHGEVKLSKSARILISKERYDCLSDQEKQQLSRLEQTVEVFEGDLKTAIDTHLKESGRYTAENLHLANEGGGYKESPTSADVAQTIKNIAKEKNISQLPHINVFLGETAGDGKLDSVKGEKEYCDILADVYKNTFFEYIFEELDIDESVKMNAQYMPNSDRYMEDLCDEIGRKGIDKYKEVLDKYNVALESLRDAGKLPTPQKIIDDIKLGKKIDLLSIIRQEIAINDEPAHTPCKQSQSFADLLNAQTNTQEEVAILDATTDFENPVNSLEEQEI